MSRPPPCASSRPHWKSMPPGSNAYEQVLEDLLQSSCSTSPTSSSSSSSSSCTSCCSCNENCPDRYRVSASAELVHTDNHAGRLGCDLQARLSIDQGESFLDAPGHGRFDGIALSRSWSPRPESGHQEQRLRPSTSHDAFCRSHEGLGHDKRKTHSAKAVTSSDEHSDGDVRICDFVEDLIRQGHSYGVMGNSTSVLHEKSHGHGIRASIDNHALSSKKHKALPPITGKDKHRGHDAAMVANHSSDGRPSSSRTSGHITGGYSAPGRIVSAAGVKGTKSGSSPETDHNGEKDKTPIATDAELSLSPSSLNQRAVTSRGRLSPLLQGEETPDGLQVRTDSGQGNGEVDELKNHKGQGTVDHSRHTGRNGGAAHSYARGTSPSSGLRPRPDRSPSSSPIPVPQLKNLHELGARVGHAHKPKQHVHLCTYTQDGIPSISVDEPEEDYPGSSDHMRPRAMSDASVLHVRRRRQLPRPPLRTDRVTQDDEHIHVHWADEHRGSPLATSVLLTSIRPRALSHGSADLPKPILKKPFGF